MKKLQLAGCLIFDEEGKLLLLHRNTPKRTQWELPGGKVESGELPEDAAKREVYEELGLHVRITKKIGGEHFIEDGYEYRYLWFLATIREGTPTLNEEKFNDFRFVRWEEVSKIASLSNNMKNLVGVYKKDKKKLTG